MTGARGEHVTFQLVVHKSHGGVKTAQDGLAPSSKEGLDGVDIVLDDNGDDGHIAAGLVVQRAQFTNVSTAANNVTSVRGRAMYADPLPFPNDTVAFPDGGGSVVLPGTNAVFWVTLAIPKDAESRVHTLSLTVTGTAVSRFPFKVLVRNFTLPDSMHASQWTEADAFGGLLGCNMVAVAPRPPGCAGSSSNRSTEQPCLQHAVVDEYYAFMAEHRVNRLAWANTFDTTAGVGFAW